MLTWLWAMTGCASIAGPCDRSTLSDAMSAGASLDAELRPEFAVAALSEACPSLFDGAGMAAAPPEYRRMTEMQWIAEHADAWIAACPAGTGVLAEAIAAAPPDAARLVVERCELGRLGFTAADLQRDGFPLLAVVLRHRLTEAGAPSTETTQLTKWLAGR